MRKYRTLLRRLWRNAPPERIPIRVHWLDGQTIVIEGYKIDGDIGNAIHKPAQPIPDVKPDPPPDSSE